MTITLSFHADACVARTALGVALLPLSLMSAQGPRPAAATIAHAVDSLSARAVADGLAPALGVAVIMDGRTIYMKSHGNADVTAGVPADDRTLWYVASTSKSFTGFGVALLADKGVLRIDAPVITLLPNARWNPAVHAESLTLAHFLSHTHRMNDNAVVSSAAFTISRAGPSFRQTAGSLMVAASFRRRP